MSLYRPLEAAPGMLRFKLLHLGEPVTLSDSLPMLEHMGLRVLDEHPHRIAPQGMAPDLDARLRPAVGVAETSTSRSTRCTRCSRTPSRASSAARSRTTTSTGWWSRARLPADEIVVLRAYAKYMRQIGFALSQSFIEATLAAHADDRAHARRAVQAALRSRRRRRRRRARGGARCAPSRPRSSSVDEPLGRPRAAPVPGADPARPRARTSGAATRQGSGAASCRSSSTRRRCRACPSRSRCSRSSSTRRASKACTCAAARSRAAACAGPTGRRTSAPKCSAW